MAEKSHTGKPKLRYPVIVEGKYDKIALLSAVDGTVITSGGFEIFSSSEKKALIRALSCDGIVILTDSDGAGAVIRSYIKGILPKDRVFSAYIPRIEGKERRKSTPSKEGILGVEGMKKEEILRVLSPFIDSEDGETQRKSKELITKTHFYLDGLSGKDNSSDRRKRLALHFRLPENMSAKALIEALNILTDLDGYRAAVDELEKKNN